MEHQDMKRQHAKELIAGINAAQKILVKKN